MWRRPTAASGGAGTAEERAPTPPKCDAFRKQLSCNSPGPPPPPPGTIAAAGARPRRPRPRGVRRTCRSRPPDDFRGPCAPPARAEASGRGTALARGSGAHAQRCSGGRGAHACWGCARGRSWQLRGGLPPRCASALRPSLPPPRRPPARRSRGAYVRLCARWPSGRALASSLRGKTCTAPGRGLGAHHPRAGSRTLPVRLLPPAPSRLHSRRPRRPRRCRKRGSLAATAPAAPFPPTPPSPPDRARSRLGESGGAPPHLCQHGCRPRGRRTRARAAAVVQHRNQQ